jgi:signal transduction histidine kinase
MYRGRATAEPQPLDLARLARRSMDLTRTRYQLPPESFAYEGPEALTLLGDAGERETALLNLLDNAVKYSREPVRVEVELGDDGDGLACLRVRDHGIGMSRAHLRLVFNRFYRIGSEVLRSRTGTGLGLFIVRSVVKRHKGAVWADSAGPERGSTFTMSLPGVLGGAAALPAAEPEKALAR